VCTYSFVIAVSVTSSIFWVCRICHIPISISCCMHIPYLCQCNIGNDCYRDNIYLKHKISLMTFPSLCQVVIHKIAIPWCLAYHMHAQHLSPEIDMGTHMNCSETFGLLLFSNLNYISSKVGFYPPKFPWAGSLGLIKSYSSGWWSVIKFYRLS